MSSRYTYDYAYNYLTNFAENANAPLLSPEQFRDTLESVTEWDSGLFDEIYKLPSNKPSMWVAMYILFRDIPGMTEVCASHLAYIYAHIRPVFNCEKFRQRYGHLEGVDHLLGVMDRYMT